MEIKEREIVRCPYCNSTKTVRVGDYRTKKRGLQKRRKCTDCASTFYEDYQNMVDYLTEIVKGR